MRLTFLGTGAAGGTPGMGRSRRRESSLLIAADGNVLIDATSQLEAQLADVATLDAVVLTHAHRDAAGGLAALGRWCRLREHPPVRLLGSQQALAAVQARHRSLAHLVFSAVEPGRRRRVAGLTLRAVDVPHAGSERFRTYAWRVSDGRSVVVYASDVARIESPLARLARGADVLAIDGAMWRRTLFSHLTIDRELPALCHWPVRRILLTQIGRTAPPHEQFQRAVAEICRRAAPAWDGMTVDLPVAGAADVGSPSSNTESATD
jgi:phosphoribosyl 1,2-cyclic phosphodiesterase